MKITHLIGNGFDISIGIPTRYEDFLKYYETQDSVKEGIEIYKKKFIEKIKSEEYKHWKDIEFALGEYTKDFNNDKKTFIDFYTDINQSLHRYLTDVEDTHLPNVSENEINTFVDFLNYPTNFITNRENEENNLRRYIVSNNYIDLDIVTFNYTSSVEIFTKGKVSNSSIHHIHGKLDEKFILFGVDNKEQIKNNLFREDEDILDLIVKPKGNSENGSNIDKKCAKRILGADLISIFGCSFGETDKTWWCYIKDYLDVSTENIIVCFLHHANDKMIRQEKFRIKREYRKKIMDIIGIEGKEEDYRRQIFIVLDKDIFNGKYSR